MRSSRLAAFAVALLCAIPEPARAAPDPAAAHPLVDSISADRGSPTMSFNTQRETAGENAIRLLTDDVNVMLRGTSIEAERELIRAAADTAEAAIGDGNTADHSVRYSIAGSVRETGIRSLSVNVETTRIRGAEPKAAARNVEPWTPRKDSPTRASRAQRDGSSTASPTSSTAGESIDTRGSGTRDANSG